MSESTHEPDVSELRHEVDGLKAQLTNLTALLGERSQGLPGDSPGVDVSEERTNRRGMLKVVGAAAVGAVGAKLDQRRAGIGRKRGGS